MESHVASAAGLLEDSRVEHYWDPQMVAGTAFQALAGSSQPAWDVWLLFGRHQSWDTVPPTPAWWEHQLSTGPPERRLDAVRFASRAMALHRPEDGHR
jgi:hypothetical protein